MSKKSQTESRWLDSSESEIVNATLSPEIEQQSIDQLKALTHRLRHAHARAKDISARQQREMLGKADPRGAKRVQDNAGSVEKVRVLFEAIQRVDGELSRREKNVAGTPNQAELSRHALELKMNSQTSEHPDPGRSASEGMHPKKRKELFKVGTTRKEIGRVSQAGKVAQARKDSKDWSSPRETFEVGIDLGSPISLDYLDRRPYAFEGRILAVSVQLKWGWQP